MSLEQQLAGWTQPSSDSEHEKQERTERMVREAIDKHPPFADCRLRVYAKGSYANNTNVRADSDVDIAVECTEAEYWDEEIPGVHNPSGVYAGVWTPEKLRQELSAALVRKFTNSVDTSATTAIRVHSNSVRIDADVVPCFQYRHYFSNGTTLVGTKIFKTDANSMVNYPEQQLVKGREKNQRTGNVYKKTVRILKRAENVMVQAGIGAALASYFIECLTYNCPDAIFSRSTWTEITQAALIHIWNSLQCDEEPSESSVRWRESNECFNLFDPGQKWTRSDGRSFAQAAWNYLNFS